ncbi:N-acetylglucosamine-6-phosphate deacetylase [Actinospica durhamensis]|uniref:N-acetylglucosamine-6-phosphate deacetylase n=1 Tax=Actinospica durhamensis TaxID=1508375 RepID=A0A941ITE5_9ACTN|nr:N-acetylglucosamine-6-phosphate deacetylase [Actinospica durhamensis]MBR7835903.1 N-acetylglucosamine-6-phosphate deacetylase [Actinospica durhamensis]
MPSLLLRNAHLVLPGAIVEGGWVCVEDGLITGVSTDAAQQPPTVGPETEVRDLEGDYLVPGFVDMHVHGGGGAAFTAGDAQQALLAAKFHLGHGTTTLLASTVTAEMADLEHHLGELSGLVQDGVLAGLHLEGPFISKSRCGAHDPALLRPPARADLERLLRAGDGTVRMITVAPELEHGFDAVRLLTDAGVIAAVGHTDATYDQTRQAIELGAPVGTHVFNAMRPVHHREPGPVTALLEQEQVIGELVNDGIHVHPSVVSLMFSAAGAHRVALITDAIVAAGMADGEYPLGPLTVRVRDGEARLAEGDSLAGSTLTMDSALRNTVRLAGVPLVDAAVSASLTPARALGLADRIGSIEVGKQADLVVLDADLQVTAVLRNGEGVDTSSPV